MEATLPSKLTWANSQDPSMDLGNHTWAPLFVDCRPGISCRFQDSSPPLAPVMPSEYPPQLPEFKPTGGLSLTPTMEKPPSRYPSRPVSADCSDTGRSVDGSQDPAQSTDTLNRPCEQKEAKDESTNPVSAQNHDPSAIPTPQHEVDWESDRDPLNAMNWSWAKRSAQIGVICANLLVGYVVPCPLSSAPGGLLIALFDTVPWPQLSSPLAWPKSRPNFTPVARAF